MSITRRRLLSSAGAATTLAILPLPVPFGRPAHAWVMAAVAVAQVCVQVYGMMKGGGSGIGSLLAQQMRMLVEIGNQIRVVNQKLDIVLQDLEMLKEAVGDLPKAVARENSRFLLGGAFLNVAELLAAYGNDRETLGQQAAIKLREPEGIRLLSLIQDHRSAIINDGSPALIPLVATCWYLEFNLRTNCLQYDPTRIREATKTYNLAFARWVQEAIPRSIEDQVKEANSIISAITASRDLNNYQCYTDIREKTEESGGGGSPHGADHPIRYHWKFSAKLNSMSSRLSDKIDQLSIFMNEFDIIQQSGVAVDPVFRDLAAVLLDWTTASSNRKWEEKYGEGSQLSQQNKQLAKSVRKNSCASLQGTPGQLSEIESRNFAKIENLLNRAVTFHHLNVVALEGKKATDEVLKRIALT